MDAPTYPPAQAYEQPKALPQAVSTRTSSIVDLRDDPEAKAIVESVMPGTFAALQMPGLGLLIEPMSLRGGQSMGGGKVDQLNQLDQKFAELNARRGVRP